MTPHPQCVSGCFVCISLMADGPQRARLPIPPTTTLPSCPVGDFCSREDVCMSLTRLFLTIDYVYNVLRRVVVVVVGAAVCISLTRLLPIRIPSTSYLGVSGCFTQEMSTYSLLILSLDCHTHTHTHTRKNKVNLKFHSNKNTAVYWQPHCNLL